MSEGETESKQEPRTEPEEGLQKRAVRGGLVTLVGHVGSNVIRLGSNLVLTRILAPEHFGVMALVNVALTGLQMFSDVGIGPNIIQHPKGEDRAFLHTAFTVQAIRGLGLTLAGLLVAWPIARFYGMPDLAWMLPLASLTAFIDGFVSTKIFRENRHLRLGRVTAIELVGQLASTVTMIATAWLTHSAVALLVGGIARECVRLVLSHAMLPGIRDGFAWDAEARKSLLSFGRWVFISTAITFIAVQIDRMVLGRLVDEATLGVYSIAAMLAAVPREVFGQLANRILYPVVAEMIRTGQGTDSIRTIRRRAAGVLALPVGWIAGSGDAVFHVLYDERYAMGGSMMLVLTLGTWGMLLSTMYGIIVLARGEPKWISFGTGAKSVLFLALAYFAHQRFGVLGIAGLVAVSELAVVISAATGTRGLAEPLVDVAATLVVLLTAAVTHFASARVAAWVAAAELGPLSARPYAVPVVVFGAIVLVITGAVAMRVGLLRRRG